jgi:O-antigen/teichoic acid export membrane protein
MIHNFVKYFFKLSVSLNLKYFLNLITIIFLARNLNPEIFGKFALLLGIIEILFVVNFSDKFGTIRYNDHHNAYESSLVSNYFTIFCQIVLFLTIIFFIKFFKTSLYEYLNLLSLIFLYKILRLTGEVNETWLELKSNYKLIYFYNFISPIISNSISIYLVIKGYGIKALIYRELIDSTLYFIFFKILFLNKIKLKNKINLIFIKNLFSFSIKYTIYRFFEILAHRMPVYYFSFTNNLDLAGIYDRSKYFTELSRNFFSQILDRVTYAFYGINVSHKRHMFQLLLTSLLFKKLIILPVSVILFFHSYEIVYLVLGPNWIEVAKIIKILSIYIILKDFNLSILGYLQMRFDNRYFIMSSIYFFFWMIIGCLLAYFFKNYLYIIYSELIQVSTFLIFLFYKLLRMKQKINIFLLFSSILFTYLLYGTFYYTLDLNWYFSIFILLISYFLLNFYFLKNKKRYLTKFFSIKKNN